MIRHITNHMIMEIRHITSHNTKYSYPESTDLNIAIWERNQHVRRYLPLCLRLVREVEASSHTVTRASKVNHITDLPNSRYRRLCRRRLRPDAILDVIHSASTSQVPLRIFRSSNEVRSMPVPPLTLKLSARLFTSMVVSSNEIRSKTP